MRFSLRGEVSHNKGRCHWSNQRRGYNKEYPTRVEDMSFNDHNSGAETSNQGMGEGSAESFMQQYREQQQQYRQQQETNARLMAGITAIQSSLGAQTATPGTSTREARPRKQ